MAFLHSIYTLHDTASINEAYSVVWVTTCFMYGIVGQ